MKKTLWLLIFLLAPILLKSEEIKTPPPTPIELPSDWWSYLAKDKEKTSQHSQELINLLKEETRKLTGDNRNKAYNFIQKINTNLQAFNQGQQLPIPEIPPPAPIHENYSIKQVIDLHREIRREKIELKANRMQQTDEAREIGIAENHLDSLWKRYQKAETRSERKLLLGLEIILYTSALEVAKQNLDYLKKTYDVDSTFQRTLAEEMEKALNRLSSNQTEESFFSSEAQQAQNRWRQAEKDLEKKAAESVVTVSGSLGKHEEASNQLVLSKLRRTHIEEVVAHNKFISAEVGKKLSLLLNNPSSINPDTLDETITQWEQELIAFEEQRKQWMARAEDLLRQYSQILSLDDPTSRSLAPTIRQIIDTTQSNILLIQQLENEINDSSFLLTTLDNQLTNLIGGQKKRLAEIGEFFSKSFGTVKGWTDKTLFVIGNNRITPFGLVRFTLILVLAFWISRWIKHALTQLAKTKKGVKKSIVYRINRLFHYLILAIAIVIALSSLGFDFSNLLIVAGALGVGLGFGLQSIFNNFISGIIILFESHLKVGDYIELDSGGLRGEIKEINVRNTLIATNDGTDVLVPNSEIISNRVINWTLREPYRRVHVPFSVAYGTDKELMKKVVIEAAKGVPCTVDKKHLPDPRVYINQLGENSLECELVVWVDERSSRRNRNTRSQYLWEIDSALREHKIVIPFPQRDLHFKDKK